MILLLIQNCAVQQIRHTQRNLGTQAISTKFAAEIAYSDNFLVAPLMEINCREQKFESIFLQTLHNNINFTFIPFDLKKMKQHDLSLSVG